MDQGVVVAPMDLSYGRGAENRAIAGQNTLQYVSETYFMHRFITTGPTAFGYAG
jgi:hypothetical protein